MTDLCVLSLERTPHRLELFRARNPHINAEVAHAIDGSKVDRSRYPDLKHSDGALGCMISHQQFWQNVVNAKRPATIFEDDAIIHHSFPRASQKIIEALPLDWHICLWGFNFDALMMCELVPGSACTVVNQQDLLRQSIDRYQHWRFKPNVVKLYRAWGTVGYAISPRGAKRLLDEPMISRDCTLRFPDLVREMVIHNVGVDVMLNAFYPTMNAFVSLPPLVVTTQDDSTIVLS